MRGPYMRAGDRWWKESQVGENSDRPSGWWALVVARVLVGMLFATQLLWMKPKDFGSPGGCPTARVTLRTVSKLTGLCQWLHEQALHPATFDISGSKTTVHFYSDFIRHTALAHFNAFGWVVFGITLFLTISLIAGLFSRLGALVGVLWSLVLALGLWSVVTPPTAGFQGYWVYLLLLALCLVLFATKAGRLLGLDTLFTRINGALGGLFRLLG